MTPQDMEDIAIALLMRRNFIETGTVTMSANDAVASKNHKLIKALEPSQKATIARLEALADKFRRAASKPLEETKVPSGLGDKVDKALAACAKWRLTDEQVEELLR